MLEIKDIHMGIHINKGKNAKSAKTASWKKDKCQNIRLINIKESLSLS